MIDEATSKPVRQGFTLLELLLVLAVIVAVLAVTLPTLSGPLDNHRLRRAADQVRTSWARARNNAMEHGRTYVFRYLPGSDTYSVEPWIAADDYLESDQLSSLGVTADGERLPLEAALVAQTERLPENTAFLGSETTADMRAEVLVAGSPDQVALSETPVIFFYPDGTTSTARLVLANQRQRFITLTMRGLTGVVHVSELQSSPQ